MERHPSLGDAAPDHRDGLWHGAAWLTAFATLLAFVLRGWGLDRLHLWGDSAYSVYSANQSLLRIALDRLADGHPPLYYYLLHFWMGGAGETELAVRYLSLLPGVATVPLVYKLGERTLGRWVGAWAAVLVALSPFLVFYSRLPRMYSLLAFMGLLSWLLFLKLEQKASRVLWVAYGAIELAILFTHYYGLLLPLSQGVLAILLWSRWRTRTLPWLGAQLFLALLYLPWALFALPSAAATTAGIISNAPWPPHALGLLEQMGMVFLLGELLPLSWARPLGWGLAAGLALLLLVALRERRAFLTSALLAKMAPLLSVVLIPTLLALAGFVIRPYFVRPRFLIFVAPVALLLLAWLCLHGLGSSRIRRSAALLAVVGVFATALVDLYRVEPAIVEADAVQIAQRLAVQGTPQDGIISHAFWQLGYLKSHLGSRAPKGYALRDISVTDLPRLFREHPRLWLAMYNVSPWHPDYPLEEWLDRNAYRACSLWFGNSRLALYALPPEETPEGEGENNFVNFDNQLRLTSYQQPGFEFRPGDVVPVLLRWRALTVARDRYKVFLHLLDGEGRLVASNDAEPVNGLMPTTQWAQGQEVEDRHALILPIGLPPGPYAIAMGLYHQDSGQRLPAFDRYGGEFGDRVTVGALFLEPYPPLQDRLSPPLQAVTSWDVSLLGYRAVQEQWRPGPIVERITPVGPLTLTFPAVTLGPPTLHLILQWQFVVHHADYGVSLLVRDVQGRIVGQQEGQLSFWNDHLDRPNLHGLFTDEWAIPLQVPGAPGPYLVEVNLRPYMGPLAPAEPIPEASYVPIAQIDERQLSREVRWLSREAC